MSPRRATHFVGLAVSCVLVSCQWAVSRPDSQARAGIGREWSFELSGLAQGDTVRGPRALVASISGPSNVTKTIWKLAGTQCEDAAGAWSRPCGPDPVLPWNFAGVGSGPHELVVEWYHRPAGTDVLAGADTIPFVLALDTAAPALAAPTPPPPAARPEVGGSNYPMYSIGKYLTEPTMANWSGGELRPVVGTYHLDSTKVATQLQTMCANGQRKIALPIWYTPLWDGTAVHGHVIDSSAGAPRRQHHQNLTALLQRIAGLCFDEVQIRFIEQGAADPKGWSAWDETQYAQNRSFILSARRLAEDALTGTTIRRLYDLGGELGGAAEGQAPRYTRRLWIDYTDQYGSGDTYGFSMIAGPGRFTRMMRAYGATRPDSYAFDVYGRAYERLARVAEEMRRAGEAGKPVLIQESFYNDALSDDEFDRAREALGLRIRAVMQWLLARGHPTRRHFSMHYPPEYAEYLGE